MTDMSKYKRIKRLENPEIRSSQYRDEQIDDLYQLDTREEKPMFQERPEPEERIIREVKVKREAMPKMDELKVQPLKLMGKEVVGSLFDRVAFLKTRIEEITNSLNIREELHNEMVSEIDIDIKEKEAFATKATDIDERRNFKLDISILRKEKRLEHVQYWRDIVELRSELRELVEKYETEKKIVDIFKEISVDDL